MNILVNVGHPAHVHLFKNFIWKMEKEGHKIKIVARENEITRYLLETYNFEYTVISKKIEHPSGLASEAITRLRNLVKISNKFKPDFVISVMDPTIGLYSKITSSTSIHLADTEHAKLILKTAVPFADVVLTPSSFLLDWGFKQIRYNGYHELAYLHPRYFKPNPEILEKLGFDKNDNIFLVRLAAFNASHDINSKKFRKEYLFPLIDKLSREGNVIISSEIKLPLTLRKYQYNIDPSKYHDILYYSKMYIGEGSTSAIEAAILGTPSIHFERVILDGNVYSITQFIGVLNELQNKYKLLYSFYNEHELIKTVNEFLLDIENKKRLWLKKRKQIIKEKIDVTAFIVHFVENYIARYHEDKKGEHL